MLQKLLNMVHQTSLLPAFRVLMIMLTMVVAGCENDLSTIEKISSEEEADIEVGKDVEALYSDLGRVKARLTAPVMQHADEQKNPYTEMPAGVAIDFYDEYLNVQSRLTAGYGISYDASDEMIARNNVVVTNISGEKLESEELIWNQKTQKIRSDQFVKITTADEIIFGEGFESNQDLSNYKIRKIRGTVRLREGDLP